jgi:hypothetical protein
MLQGQQDRALHLVIELRTAAALTPSSPGGRQAPHGPLTDKIALELGQGSKDVEDELPAGRGGIDGLGQGPESDLAPMELFNGLDELPDRSS